MDVPGGCAGGDTCHVMPDIREVSAAAWRPGRATGTTCCMSPGVQDVGRLT